MLSNSSCSILLVLLVIQYLCAPNGVGAIEVIYFRPGNIKQEHNPHSNEASAMHVDVFWKLLN